VNNIYNQLVSYFRNQNSRGRLLIYRNEEELSFLHKWIRSEKKEKFEKLPDNKNISLQDILKSCTKCGNALNKRPGWGSGMNGIMIIINTPLNISLFERNQLKDKSKELLVNMLKAINLNITECYVTNMIKCETEGASCTPGIMLKNCTYILTKEINKYDPNIIIIMGDDIAIKRIIDDNNTRNWFRIEHPLNILKNTNLKRKAWETLQKIKARSDENS
jgi:uracil-DNA glycosylase family 4